MEAAACGSISSSSSSDSLDSSGGFWGASEREFEETESLNSNFAGKVKLTASALQECYKNL